MLGESKQVRPNLPKVAAAADIMRALHEALASCARGDMRISLRGAFDLCGLCVDPAELGAALRQLALNASELMPRGGPLEVRVQQHTVARPDSTSVLPAGRYLAIRFSDAGLGMPLEILSRVFDASGDDKAVPPVIVARLRAVRRFALRAGGRLEVESRLGYGAKAEIFLPAA